MKKIIFLTLVLVGLLSCEKQVIETLDNSSVENKTKTKQK